MIVLLITFVLFLFCAKLSEKRSSKFITQLGIALIIVFIFNILILADAFINFLF